MLDYTTINLERFRKLPVHKCPPTYRYGDQGNACAGDAPGFPTYFTRSVFTSHGNSPHRGATLVLTIPGEEPRVVETAEWKPGEGWETRRTRFQKLMVRLWNPLPLDHPRVRMWIEREYQQSAHCYIDDSKKPQDRLVIWPVPDYKLKAFRDDPRFSDEWRTKEKAAIDQANQEIIEAIRPLIRPENHSAVRSIQEFYPFYQPEINLIENPPEGKVITWWERHATQPTPQECEGLGSGHRHPIGNPCQTCGHPATEEEMKRWPK